MTDSANDDIVLELDNIGISYFTRVGEIPAVPNFSLRLKRGESYGLVGESGCGKSTVAMAIMNYLGKNGGIVNGTISFEGRDMQTMSEEELRQTRGSKIAMVYQEPMSALNPSLTIGTQLKEVLIYHENITNAEATERSIQMLSDVNMPDPDRVMARYPHQISGGQQQRVVIAMAMLSNPSLLLLDEPTTALDVTVEATVIDLIAQLREKFNTTLLYISHNLGLIVKVCDRAGVMYSGSMVEEGTIEELFKKTKHPYTFGLFDCIPTLGADKHTRMLEPIPGQVSLPHERPPGCAFGPRCKYFKPGVCDQGDIPIEHIDHGETHRARCLRVDEIEHVPANVGSEVTVSEGEVVLDINGMSKFYEISDMSLSAIMSGQSKHFVKANENLNFEAQRGRTIAIVGESGCGKSTFAKVLTGLETATEGEIMFEGTNIGAIPVQKRDKKLIRALQMVFQNPDGTLNPSHSVGHCIGRVIKKFGIEKDPKKVRELVGDMLDVVRLPRAFITRKPRQLSGGQKQRIAVARAFAGNPSMVIADEPVSALDVSVQAAVINLLNDVQKQYNTTLLFISHDLSVVRFISDEIVVMYLGQIMEAGEADKIFQPPYHPYTEALLSAVPIPDPDIVQKRIRVEGEIP
ncbi:MAG: ABC transporter ATP-binding protein, partial [Rhodospirillaceae bacterium]|nr:ABC transporter ATP-binding protein [Rhodospirillaceae bacterium]